MCTCFFDFGNDGEYVESWQFLMVVVQVVHLAGAFKII